jgi:hypothetical protein
LWIAFDGWLKGKLACFGGLPIGVEDLGFKEEVTWVSADLPCLKICLGLLGCFQALWFQGMTHWGSMDWIQIMDESNGHHRERKIKPNGRGSKHWAAGMEDKGKGKRDSTMAWNKNSFLFDSGCLLAF